MRSGAVDRWRRLDVGWMMDIVERSADVDRCRRGGSK
jgi:hypothetical protein